MKSIWTERLIKLKFQLGEISLFSVTFPALVLNTHFTKLTSHLTELRPPFEEFSSKLEVIVMRSHPIEEELPRLSLTSRSLRYVPAQYNRYYIDLHGSFQDYMRKFSAKSRATIVRKVRKFARASEGEIHWCEFRSCNEMADFYQLARTVSEKTYQERLLDAGLPNDDKFQQDIMELAARDSVRGYILFLGERPISYLFCPIQENALLYQYLGYDPEFQHKSPGTVLQYLVLEKLFSENQFRMFDFTEGEGSHKEFFSTGNTRCADIYYFRRTLRNLFLLSFHACLSILSGAMVQVSELLGLKAPIKKFFRSKA
jgi:CelD/BcsL family acetyltransferase involved in cellulose biosynthesis